MPNLLEITYDLTSCLSLIQMLDMKDKDNTIAALKSEMAGLQAALLRYSTNLVFEIKKIREMCAE